MSRGQFLVEASNCIAIRDSSEPVAVYAGWRESDTTLSPLTSRSSHLWIRFYVPEDHSDSSVQTVGFISRLRPNISYYSAEGFAPCLD